MLWLPTLVAHPSRVGISDHSALALERGLLAGCAKTAAAQLTAAMLADGWLVVWAQGLNRDLSRSIAELARWLAGDLERMLSDIPAEADGVWEQLQDWDARGLAAGAIAAPRRIDPAHNAEWRTQSSAYVARLVDTLREHPCAWPDDGDEEFRRYVEIDEEIAWRLPRLVSRLGQTGTPPAELEARVHTARLEAMKELAYGASHEINNPLANISGRAQILLKGETEPHRRRMLAAIDSQALRAHEMISDLMHFARPPRLDRQKVCLETLLRGIIAELESELTERRIFCEILNRGLCDILFADSDQLHMAVKGIIQNAIEAIGLDGRIVITSHADRDAGMLQLTIADTGRGIPEEIRPRIFDPFFSGREAGRGLGFGLAKAWRILTDHGGSIALADEAGFSTAFRLHLPSVAPAV